MDSIRTLPAELTGDRPVISKLLWLAFFSVAMGFLEAAVVIYLRKIYYPEGFRFPLATIAPAIGLVEFMREAATLIMLIAVGVIAGKDRMERFIFFIYCFGIWDVIYYVGLKLFLDWPATLLDWDILFLIPIPWVGPVLAPCIVALTMIVTACIFTVGDFDIKRINMFLIAMGCLIIITSFCLDYLQLIFSSGSSCWLPGSATGLFAEINNYVPVKFNWPLFLTGESIILFSVFHALRRH